MKPKKFQRRQFLLLRRLRQIRIAKKIPQKVLCHNMGYHKMTLGRWERGETMPSFQALHDWCEALGLRIEVRSVTGSGSAPRARARRSSSAYRDVRLYQLSLSS